MDYDNMTRVGLRRVLAILAGFDHEEDQDFLNSELNDDEVLESLFFSTVDCNLSLRMRVLVKRVGIAVDEYSGGRMPAFWETVVQEAILL